MRVFLIWAAKTSALNHLMSELNNNGHELIYWVGHHFAEKENRPAGAIFHSHRDAGLGIPSAELSSANFPPPEEKIIKALEPAEPTIITILNNDHKMASISEYRHFYYELIRYWLGVIKKFQPEAIIFPVEPHSGFDNVIYELAKLLSIKTLFFNETRVSDRMLYMSDYKIGSESLLKEMENCRQATFSLDDLSEDIREYYKRQAIKKNNEPPQHVKFIQGKYSFWHRVTWAKIWASVKEGTIIKKSFSFIFMQKGADMFIKSLKEKFSLLLPNLKKDYARLEKELDLSKPYVYAALQVQPERTTAPVGGVYMDQILIIKTIAAALPEGWKIYVKEHPLQWIRKGIRYTVSRYPGYYDEIAKIKNTQIAPINTSSYALMDKARAVATVSGAPGWEALMRSKPSLIFGYAWYKNCPGVFNINGQASCGAALNKIEQGYEVDQQAVINYLKCLDNTTIHGYIAYSNEKNSKLTYNENIKSITDLILKELK